VVDDVFATISSGSALLRDMDRIECPVLVCWGDKDRILPLPKHGPRFRDEIPGVEFRVWKGLGHTPMWDDHVLVASAIADFATAASQRAPAAVSAG
jgi:pimeloyl-ACP methyl ester carboxylesterase